VTVIGVTGPTGAGKTTLLGMLEQAGFQIVDCDRLYYALLRADEGFRRQLTDAFGPVFLPDGSLDRPALAARVFGDSGELDRLNAIVYPAVYAAVEQKVKNCSQLGVAIDAVNLVESGLNGLCSYTVAVTAPPEVRLRRIMARDHLSEQRAAARIAAQKPDSFYRAHCGAVIENGADDPSVFQRCVKQLLADLLPERDRGGPPQMMKEADKAMDGKEWMAKVLCQKKNGYDRLDGGERPAMEDYCAGYRAFLDAGKTERECAAESVRLAESRGFRPYTRGMALKAGDKVYLNNRDKMLLLAVIGEKSLAEGAVIAAAHIDSPRLDLKPAPLYEDSELAYLKTHYYGGIRKYQWVAVPLELRGVVALRSGEVVRVAIGQGSEPKLFISDLLPHLGQEQGKKPLADGVAGEQLNLLVGSEPLQGAEKERVKLAVMKRLYEKYGFAEEDFISAELEAVPAFPAVDIGLDGSMIGGYGQDDRVCGYAALRALLDLDGAPERTAVCVLADKEEVGSVGVTGMQTAAFDTFMEDLCGSQGVPVRACLERSFCLSTDVTAAFDPNFPEVFEKRNAAQLNYGVGLCKYTGRKGKGGASDASAELVAYIRRIFDGSGVVWQMAELGKVDAGGGGTVAAYMANRNIDTLDAGVPVLSMHAPFEVTAKLDCYMTYKGILALYRDRT